MEKEVHRPVIVVACDSMKGSLSSLEVADAAAEGILAVFPQAEVRKVSVADGGEGTMEAIVNCLGGTMVQTRVTGPMGTPVDARYGWISSRRTAVIEMAEAAGLTLVPPQQRNPLEASTLGVGQLVLDALANGARRLLICLGGSATNDGAMGMLQALGVRFYDAQGCALNGCGRSLAFVDRIDLSGLNAALAQCSITVACDVDNPLYGPLGAAQVFARQKGADDGMVEVLDHGLRNYARAIAAATGRDVSALPGAGAAGGMGGGLVGLLGAQMQSGVEMVLQTIDFDARLRGADLVLTGEGRIDRQTLRGKTPMGVLRHATAMGIPTVAICGSLADDALVSREGFLAVLPIVTGPCTMAQAMLPATAHTNVTRTAAQIARLFFR